MIEKITQKLTDKCREWYEIWDANHDDEYADGKNEGFIEALDIVQEVAKEYGNASDNDLTVVSALPSLYPLQRFEEEAIHKVVASAKNGGWIPCSERLPEEHETENAVFDPLTLAEIDVERHMVSDLVLVTVRDCDHDTDFVCDDITVDGKWVNFGCESYEVLAWQPLPAPYQKGE